MMVRGKLQLKRIEDKNSRHVTFSKRRTGLIKKAKELSVLCDVEVAVFVFSGKGKLYQFATEHSLKKILESCQMQKEADVACGSAKYAKKIPERQMNTGGDINLLQAVQRFLEEQKVEKLDVTEITQLEHRLDVILHQLRTKKSQLMMEAVSVVHEKGFKTSVGDSDAGRQLKCKGSEDRLSSPGKGFHRLDYLTTKTVTFPPLEEEKQLRGDNQSTEQEVQIPAMVNEEGQYQQQPQPHEDNIPLPVNDIDELYAAGADDNCTPLYLHPFYML